MKVVINRCWGGFSISLACAKLMAEMGNPTAIAEVAEWEQATAWIQSYLRDKKWPDDCPKEKQKWLEPWVKYGHTDAQFYGYGHAGETIGYERHSKELVAAVEQLGSEVASGDLAELKVVEIPDGTQYEIDEYDGMESIHEVHQSWS